MREWECVLQGHLFEPWSPLRPPALVSEVTVSSVSGVTEISSPRCCTCLPHGFWAALSTTLAMTSPLYHELGLFGSEVPKKELTLMDLSSLKKNLLKYS